MTLATATGPTADVVADLARHQAREREGEWEGGGGTVWKANSLF